MATKTTKRTMSWRGAPAGWTYQGHVLITDRGRGTRYLVFRSVVTSGPPRYLFQKVDEAVTYRVTHDGPDPRCDCPQGLKHHRGRGKLCRHLAAIGKLREMGRIV